MRCLLRITGRRCGLRRALLRAAAGLILTAVTMRHPEAAYLGPVADAVIELATARPLL